MIHVGAWGFIGVRASARRLAARSAGRRPKNWPRRSNAASASLEASCKAFVFCADQLEKQVFQQILGEKRGRVKTNVARSFCSIRPQRKGGVYSIRVSTRMMRSPFTSMGSLSCQFFTSELRRRSMLPRFCDQSRRNSFLLPPT